MPNEQATAAFSHRPVRGAWLIDEKITAAEGVRIFSEFALACCRWWEGRNSLLIKFADDRLMAESRLLLQHHDPDEVVALSPVTKRIVEEVDGLVHLLAFSEPVNAGQSVSHGDFQFQSVAALPTKTNISRRDQSLFDRDPPTLLLFAFADECPSEVRHCVTLNFGTYSHWTRPDGKIDFSPADRLWKELPNRVYRLASVEDFAAALEEIAGDWQRPGLRFVSPMQLAEGRDDVQHRWPDDQRYQVFIGDSFEDAELFWNQPIADGSWRLCSRFHFYLPASLATHPTVRIPLQKWLCRFTNAGSNQHNPPFFVSRSMTESAIRQVADQLLTENQFAIHKGVAERHTQLAFREDQVAEVRLSRVERSHLVEMLRVNSPSDTLLLGLPEILDRNEQSGRWMADVWLETPPQRELARGKSSIWRLPASRSQNLVSSILRSGCRVQRNGYPSVALEGMRPMARIHQPRPFHAFEMLVRGERRCYFTTDLRRALSQRESAAFSVGVSDKGQLYRGTVDLFGSLATAAHYVESVLWRTIFRELASEKASADASLESEITSVLQKEIPHATKLEREGALSEKFKDAAKRFA